MRRAPYAKVAQRNAALLERIRALKAEHPFWGYRRIWAYLRYVDGLIANQKRVYGVMKAADLLVKPKIKLRARRKADTTKPRPIRPNEWWGIDMTKVMIEGFGWIYLVVVLDWHTKKVVGHYPGCRPAPSGRNLTLGARSGIRFRWLADLWLFVTPTRRRSLRPNLTSAKRRS
jgi:putative transposase